MKILVYGAGNIGSLYAALLKESGQDVSILARGKRLADIREHGIQLENVDTGEQTTAHVNAVEELGTEDAYDIVLVVLPKNRVSEVLPKLQQNKGTPSIIFFGNNAAGPEEMTEALGRGRVLLGFPGAAAVKSKQRIRYLILSAEEQPTTVGELDGTRSPRIKSIANALEGAGLPVSICSRMDAWLKTHAAEIIPTASALYMANGDIERLARTRDALLLMVRAIKEGYKVLARLGIPITPKSHRVFHWFPQPLLVVLVRQMLRSATTSIKIGHALEARAEMSSLAGEFLELIRESGLSTPSIDISSRHLDPQAEPLPDGSSKIPLNWSAVWRALGLVAALVGLFSLVRRSKGGRHCARRQDQ